MPTEHSQKIASLELGRIISMFAIVLLHNHILISAPLFDGTPWVGYIVNQLARFSVPFFFLLSGYLIQPKLSSDPFHTLISYSLPLIKIWVVWSVICLLMPFNWEMWTTQGYMAERSAYWGWLMQNPLNTFMEGGLVHLWFIPGLVCAVAIIALGVKLQITVLLPVVAIALYLYGLAAGSYDNITGIVAPFFTRNGPFFSTLLVWLGYEIRRKNYTLSIQVASLLAVIGMCIHFFEAYWLTGFDKAFNIHDFLLGTPFWGLGLFFILLNNPLWGNHPYVFKLSSMVLGVYIVHLPVVIAMQNITGMLGLETYIRDIVLVAGTTIVTLLFVWLVSRTILRKVFFR